MTYKILVDMSQSMVIDDSVVLGTDVLSALQGVGSVHHTKVQQAGFMVLKSPRIPSILVETAFISNPDEEQKLRDINYQRRLAESILKGLKRAMPRLIARRNGGGETLQAVAPSPAAPTVQSAQAAVSGAREHIVKPGETLSAIARLYDIHVETLRFLNGIEGSDLAVGTKLLVPARSSEL